VASSSSTINYSVRQNKTIERSLVFGGLRRYGTIIDLRHAVYVGLGSAWFVDFEMAHRELGLRDMISIESDEVTFSRANFNRPYRTVELVRGISYDEVPKLLIRPDLTERPWVIWLDYDQALDGSKVDELVGLVERAPANTALLATFNAHPRSYGDGILDRLETFQGLFGDAFPSEDFPNGVGLANDGKVQAATAEALLSTLDSAARRVARPGGFVAGFNLHYQDGSPMVTVGGFLPSPEKADEVQQLVAGGPWRCFTTESINTPPLTPKEISALRTLLPADTEPSREDLKRLGFDLEERHLRSFVRYYLDYPLFVQAAR
jgi:hypothetical protein